MNPRILIVGAGIGGLTLARLLEQGGCSPQVIEKTLAFRPLGAGIILAANAMAVLERAGLAARLEHMGFPLSDGAVTDANGKTLLPLNFSSSKAKAIALHRGDLHRTLLEGLSSDIRWACTVEHLEQTENAVRVGLSTGAEAEFDAVVGADGIHSSIRRFAISHRQPKYSGYSSWRFVVSQAESIHLLEPVEMWGQGKRLGLVPIGQGCIYGIPRRTLR